MTLERGDQLAHIVTEIPGPLSIDACRRLAGAEAPGINTLYRGQPGIVWAGALGSNVVDLDGNRYIDLTSGFGVAAVGHRHPAVVEAIQDQSRVLIHGLGDVSAHLPRLDLAERLCALAPMDDARAYFAVSGSDAVEVAIKTAVLHHRGARSRIVAFDPAYHGLTLGALAVTSRPEFRRPFAEHLHPLLQRLPFGCSTAQLQQALGSREVAAVVVEPIVGREGVLMPPKSWLRDLADIAKKTGTLLIADEIFTGFGRTGSCFVVEAEGVTPDLLCCGKALGGGLAIGVTLGSADVMASWSTQGEALHTGTFVANPLSMRAALAVLDILRDDDLTLRAERLGKDVGHRLCSWPERFTSVEQTRGRGLLWGLEMRSADAASALVDGLRRRGILMLAGGPEGKVAQLVPALTINEDQLEATLLSIEELLDAISS